jgi:thiol-disulfide isomerase/thioredoxin
MSQQKTWKTYWELAVGACLSFLPGLNIAQQVFDQVKAPEVVIKEWITSGEAWQKPHSLESKVVVLEFWASWCRPCIEAIPHLNEMASKYGSDSLLFISINGQDDTGKIEKFLSKNPMKTIVAIDDKQQTAKNFGVQSLPQAFLIDKNGYLRWQGTPGLLTDEFMKKFLEEDSIIIPKITTPLLYSLNIALTTDRSTSSVSYTERGGFGFSCKNRNISSVVGTLLKLSGMEEYQLRFTGKIPLEPTLDIEVKASSKFSEAFILDNLLQSLSAMFAFTITSAEEEVEIWHITSADPSLLETAKSKEGTDHFSVFENDEEIVLKNAEFWQIASFLQDISGKNIDYDVGFGGKYDMTLPKGDFALLLKRLNDYYGLNMDMKKLPMEIKTIYFGGGKD